MSQATLDYLVFEVISLPPPAGRAAEEQAAETAAAASTRAADVNFMTPEVCRTNRSPKLNQRHAQRQPVAHGGTAKARQRQQGGLTSTPCSSEQEARLASASPTDDSEVGNHGGVKMYCGSGAYAAPIY